MIHVSTIDKDLRPYLDPNDRFDQKFVLQIVDDKEVANGICRALALFWLVDCVKTNAKAPNECMHQMKANGKSYFKQLASAQKSYKEYLSDKEFGKFGSMLKMISLASAGNLSVIATSRYEQGGTNASELVDAITTAAGYSNTQPRSVLIGLAMKSAGHCIAAIEEQTTLGSKWYVFDPNFGVLIVDTMQDRLEDALDVLWQYYDKHFGMLAGFAYAVKT